MKTLLAILVVASGSTAWKAGQMEKKKPVFTDREKVMNVAKTQVGIVEKTGRNDGEVEKYIAHVGLDPKAHLPYCAAFVSWCGYQALGDKSPYPKSAWSPTHLKGSSRLTPTTVVRSGDLFGIYDERRKRVSHVGFLQYSTKNYIITREANTSPSAALGSAKDRDGHGVYDKRRRFSWKLRHKNWFKD